MAKSAFLVNLLYCNFSELSINYSVLPFLELVIDGPEIHAANDPARVFRPQFPHGARQMGR